jgi:hypothetical protein
MSGITNPTSTCTAKAMPLPLLWNRPNLRFIEGAGEGGDGGDGGNDGGGGGFTPITTQADLEKTLGQRLAREREKFKDYDQLKQAKDELDSLKAKNATAEEKAVNDAREEGRNEIRAVLAQERVSTALGRALTGRIPDAEALLNLDRSQFIKDGHADTDAIKTWVDAHSSEATKAPPKRDDGAGRRDSSASSGSTQAGRDRYAERHGKKTNTSS